MTPSERAAIDDRIRWLQWRTIGVGWAACLCVGAGGVVTLFAVGDLAGLMRGAGADELPAFHVPSGLRHADGWPLLSLLFAGLALVGAWGLSTGRLRRAHAVASLVLCLMAGVADVNLSAPLHQPLFVLSSPLERLVGAARYAEADRLVETHPSGEHQQREAYVRAQIALRAGDLKRLESIGRPLLESADLYIYAGRAEWNDPISPFNDPTRDLRLSVLAAVDRGLHGEPISAAGLAVALERGGHAPSGLGAAIRAGAGLGSLVAGLLLVALWRHMRGHVLRIIDLDG